MESKTITINSENRNSGTTSDFSFTIPSDGDYTHVCVLGCNVPVSYYLIQAPYNTLILNEAGTLITVTIPVGNYNVASFKTIVVPVLNAASIRGWVYSMAFDNDFSQQSTGMFTYTVTGFTVPPIITFPAYGELHAQFGFSHASTNTFSVGGVLVSSTVVSFVPETVLTIASDLCDDGKLLTIFHGNATPYSNISFQCQTDLYTKRIRGNASNSIYNFSVLSKSGTKIDLNGVPLLLNLLFYKKNDSYKQNISDYIRYKLLTDPSNNIPQ